MTSVRRLCALIAAGALTVVLAGCTSSTTGTTSDLRTASALSADLGFDDGADLAAGSEPQWSDPFASDSSFTAVAISDDGDSWGYADADTSCTLGFWQGGLTDSNIDLSASDIDASDALLAATTGSAVADISDYTESDIADFVSGTSLISARSVLGADSDAGTTYVVSARAFTALDQGLVASLTCPSATDVLDQWQTYLENDGAFAAYFLPSS